MRFDRKEDLLMLTNFHTHTRRCRHAYGSDEDYVKEAVKNGYQILGFSDHTCWPFKNYTSRIRMKPEQFEGYVQSVKQLREKYKDQIEIRLGMEAEYEPEYMDWMLDLCIEHDIQYLVFGHHFVNGEEAGTYSGMIGKRGLREYVQSARRALDTGMYACFAHPELFLRSDLLQMDEDVEQAFTELARLAAEKNIPVEYNCTGMIANQMYHEECYPHHRFWEIAAKEGCKAVIGMDCHQPDYLDKRYYEQARDYLESLGMEIVEDIGVIDYKALKEMKNRMV